MYKRTHDDKTGERMLNLTARNTVRRWVRARALAFVGLTGAVLIASAPHAVRANEALLGGRAFSPPDQTIPMGEDWNRQPIDRKMGDKAALAVTLDQQLYPALTPLIKKFAEAKGIDIAVQNGTCGTSAGALSEKKVDMGGFCCPPGLTDRLPGLKYHTVGIGALALITNKDNPTDNITMSDARKMFGNDIRDWSELPMSGLKTGEHEPVRAIVRFHCKLRPGHWRLIMDKADDFGWGVTEVSAIKDMVQQVSISPGSIGYETLWHITRLAREERSVVKTLSVNGAAPTDDAAVARGDYPLYRVFNITTWDTAPAHTGLGDELAAYLVDHANELDPQYAIIPAAELHKNGWIFEGDELVGEPR